MRLYTSIVCPRLNPGVRKLTPQCNVSSYKISLFFSLETNECSVQSSQNAVSLKKLIVSNKFFCMKNTRYKIEEYMHVPQHHYVTILQQAMLSLI